MILADTSIKRPVFTTMIITALMVLGIFSYNRMAVDLFPDVDFPFVVVVTAYPGADPEAVESEITKKIEDQINTISSLKHLQSTSQEGVSQVVAEFNLGVDVADKALEVREKISTIMADLPDDAEDPIIQRYNPDAEPVISLVVSGSRPLKEITTLTKDVIKKRIESISGVGAVRLVGGAEREIQIELDAQRLEAFSISVQDVQNAVRAANIEIPAGRIDRGESELTLRTLGKFANWRDFGDLVVEHRKGKPVRLSDLATVSDGTAEQRSYSRFNGQEAVALDIIRQTGANTVRVADDVLARVEELKSEIPSDIGVSVAYDNSVFIRDSVHDVIVNMIYGSLLAVLVIFFFLYNWRTTLISALAIPTSVIGTFTFMYVMGFSINFMSLLGLSIAVGLLIDDAIVVIENIYRNFHGGIDAAKAASIGTAEIGLAVMAATLTIVAVFVPVGFMGGIVGRFFVQFGLTVAVSILVSLFVAFTLTPMMFSQIVKHPEEQDANVPARWFGGRWLYATEHRFNRGFDKVKARYRDLLGKALRHRFITMMIASVLFFGSFGLLPFIGTEFLPQSDQGQFFVEFETAAGTSLRETARLIAGVEDEIKKLPEVVSVYTALGSGGRLVNEGVITLKLTPLSERERHVFKIVTDIRNRFASIPGMYLSVSLEPSQDHGRPISFSVQGEDLRILRRIAKAVEDSTRSTVGAREVRNSLVGARPEAQIIVDRDKASELGLSMARIASTLRTLVDGDDVTTYKEGNEEYNVRLRLITEDRSTQWAVENLMIKSERDIPGLDQFFVPLKQVARLRPRGGPTEIRRYDRQREVVISGNTASGAFAGDVRAAALSKIQFIPKPPGYRVIATGEAEMQAESFGYIITALILSVMFIYFILAAQYESFNDPLAIMLSLPMALVGAFAGLFIFRSALSIMSMIGIVLLMGLVTKNAILLVDFIKQARARGESRLDAILQSGPIRLRPILMTTLATIFGVLPLALGIGPGAEFRAPMARAVIGGMISSTVLTLIVVPVVYSLLDDIKEKIKPTKK